MRLLSKEEVKERAQKFSFVKNAKDEKEREQWMKFYLTDSDYIDIYGHLLSINRPRIDHVIYFDDTLPDPLRDGVDKRAVFMDENLEMNFTDFGIEEWKAQMKDLHESGSCCGGYLTEPFYLYNIDERKDDACVGIRFTYDNYERRVGLPKGCARAPLTQQDIDELEAIVNQLKEKYVARLDRYYKRFSDKIYASGYWADR